MESRASRRRSAFDGFFGPLVPNNKPASGGSLADFFLERQVLPVDANLLIWQSWKSGAEVTSAALSPAFGCGAADLPVRRAPNPSPGRRPTERSQRGRPPATDWARGFAAETGVR